MIRTLTLLAVVLTAVAMDSWSLDPALHRDDRQGHAVAGLAIGAVSAALIETMPATRDWKPWQKFAAATLVATAVGIGKEVYDEHNGGNVEVGDVVATGLGGALGSVSVQIVWRF